MLRSSKAKIVSQEVQKTFCTNKHVPCTKNIEGLVVRYIRRSS